MKARIILRTVLALSVSLFIQSCMGDEILLTDEEIGGGNESTEQIDPALSWSASTCKATLGAENSFPTLTNKYSVPVSFASSEKTVATIDSDGTVTLVAAGTTTISASSSETDTYEASSAAYTLTVIKNAEGIAWSADSCVVTIGGENTFPTLSNPGEQAVTYSSSNENVATISSDGTITLVAAGTTTITATSEDNGTFEGSSVFYTLEVTGEDSDRKSAGLSWSASTCTAIMASENEFPTLNNPNGLEVGFTSSSSSVATINEEGEVTLVGEGTVTISATSEANDEYSAGSASYMLKVVKCPVSVAWSESSFTAILEDSNAFPELTVSPEIIGQSISYASSNTSSATIDSEGNIILKGTGTTTISATFAGNDTYKAASASFTLVVTSSTDEGAGSFTYASTGDTSSDDDISNTTFTRLITITYSGTSVTVTGDYYGYVTTSGAAVTVNNTGTENIIYKLTGTSTNGSFKLYSSKKQAILLNGLTLTNPSGAAINNQSGKRTFVMIEGSNTLADGSSAAYSTSDDEDMKAVIFSEGQLIFSGSGSLNVNASNKQGKSAIVSDDYVRFMASPTVTVTSGSSAGHGIRGKEYVQLSDGELTVSTSAAMKKGIGSDDYVLVEGGTTTINVSGGVAYDSDDAEYKGTAGIKADNYFAMTGGSVTIKNTGAGGKGVSAGSYDYDETSHTLSDSYISGGTLKITTTGSESNDVSSKGIKIGYKEKSGNKYVYAGNLIISGGSVVVNVSKSEGIEAKGNLTFNGGETYSYSTADDAINCQGELNVNNGFVYAHSTQNDAMDSNGNMKLNGGYVFAVTTKGQPEVALDANTESGYKLYINSGATVVAYGGLENGYSASQTVYSMSCTAGSWNALHNGSAFIAAFKAPSGVSTVAVSAPSLKSAYKGASVSGSTLCNGIWATSGISGGSTSSLGTYSGGMGGGGGMGGPGGGW
ncbi:MAG: carbohydrate-binding domain-containing protein [Bacteroidales bacterium]|nr:carbohydrate-binding domain-containing protein [Bacteroidales bacterium]